MCDAMTKVVAHDVMQDGYVHWRSEPVGRNVAPGFTPQLTPKQMLTLGTRQRQAVLHWAYDSRTI